MATITNSINDKSQTLTTGGFATVTSGPSLTLTSGDLTISGSGTGATGNLNLPNTNTAGSIGEITFGGNRWISNHGTDNTFLGEGSGNTTLTGSQNVCMGTRAGSSLTNGVGNTAIGYQSLIIFTGLGGNVAVGTESLPALTSGDSNTAIGEGAGQLLQTGNSNTLIGAIAGQTYASNESNNICLGSRGVIGDNTTMRLGIPASGGDLTAAYIGGTYGVTPAVSGTNEMVICNDQGQLGTQAIPGGSNPAASCNFDVYQTINGTNITGNGGAPYNLQYDSVYSNVGGNYSTITNVFTAPNNGVYAFSCSVSTLGYDPTFDSYIVVFNGSVKNYEITRLNPGVIFDTAGEITTTGSIVIPMTAGDTMSVSIQVGTSTQTISLNFGGGPFVRNYFQGYQVA